jgi:hypothetical protein
VEVLSDVHMFRDQRIYDINSSVNEGFYKFSPSLQVASVLEKDEPEVSWLDRHPTSPR